MISFDRAPFRIGSMRNLLRSLAIVLVVAVGIILVKNLLGAH